MKIKMIVAAGAMLVAAVGYATPASAAFADCPSNEVCLFGSNDFVFLTAHRAGGGGVQNLSGDANDTMDSWANRSTNTSAGYANSNGGGDCQTFQAGQSDNNVNVFNSDEVSSWKTNGGC